MNLLPHILGDFFLPQGASNLAHDVDWAWNVILWTTTVFFIIVVGAMTFFVFKYRRRTANDATPEITHNTPLELAWSIIPLGIVMYFFYVGFVGFLNYDTPATDSVPIAVEAKKWQFTFTYPNGAQDRDLYLLKGQAVRLDLHSVDVLHAIYLPTFRTQRNLIPARQTTIWFIPEEFSPKEGWPIFCTQYCGDGHSRMFSHVHVLDRVAYDDKMKELANPFKKKVDGHNVWVPYPELGKTLYSQLGCSTCHTINGGLSTGPTWLGLWKRDHEFSFKIPENFTLLASDPDSKWEEYLTESMLQPDVKLVRFNGVNYHGMSSFASQLSGSEINDEKRRAIIAFIKSLNPTQPPLFDPKSDVYDADKHPDIHPEFLRARQAATQTQPGQ